MVIAAAPVDETAVRAALAEVADPELSAVSVVDLGIVDRVEVGPARISVDLLPTFIGCPALDLIRSAVEDRLSAFGRPVDVEFVGRVAWTSDRITLEGLKRLARAGIAPPGATACPHCESADIAMDNLFGPTQCRSLYYCRGCRQPFEAIKPI